MDFYGILGFLAILFVLVSIRIVSTLKPLRVDEWESKPKKVPKST